MKRESQTEAPRNQSFLLEETKMVIAIAAIAAIALGTSRFSLVFFVLIIAFNF